GLRRGAGWAARPGGAARGGPPPGGAAPDQPAALPAERPPPLLRARGRRRGARRPARPVLRPGPPLEARRLPDPLGAVPRDLRRGGVRAGRHLPGGAARGLPGVRRAGPRGRPPPPPPAPGPPAARRPPRPC